MSAKLQLSHAEATSMKDLVHKDQLALIQTLCRKLDIDEDEECRAFHGCRTIGLSVEGAQTFIAYLKEMG